MANSNLISCSGSAAFFWLNHQDIPHRLRLVARYWKAGCIRTQMKKGSNGKSLHSANASAGNDILIWQEI